jgi:hypothetical protein
MAMTLPVASSIKEAEAPDLFNTTSVPASEPDTKNVDKTTATPNAATPNRILGSIFSPSCLLIA